MRVFLATFLVAVPLMVEANSAETIETLVVRAARTPLPEPAVGSSISVVSESNLSARQAGRLGLGRSTLYGKFKALKLDPRDYRV